MSVSQFLDAAIKYNNTHPKGADDPPYSAPKGHDREMRTSERESITNGFVAAHKRRKKLQKPANAIVGDPTCCTDGA